MPKAKTTKPYWCKHISLEEETYLTAGCFQIQSEYWSINLEETYVMSEWKFCPICGTNRPEYILKSKPTKDQPYHKVKKA
jgi:hypothetical protein